MKRILVPIDFSVCAEKAFNYAVLLAKKGGGEVILLHACDFLHYPFADKKHMINEYNDLKTTELTGRLAKLKDTAEESGVTITTQLYDGDVVDSILSVSERKHIDLIVMGTWGATGLETILLGTKTATIISKSAIPVIAIPADYISKEPQNILIAINDAEQDVNIFEPVFLLGNLFSAKVNIAVFSDDKAQADELMEHSRLINRSGEKLKKSFSNTNIEMLHLSGSDFYQSLQQYINNGEIDLLVMITHKKGFVQNLFSFSMTRQMAYHTTVPLLSLHSSF